MNTSIAMSPNETRVITHFEESLINFLDSVISGFKSIYRLPLFIAWILGFILLVTFGLLYTVVFYAPILLARKNMKQTLNDLILKVDKIKQRDLMEIHLEIEELRERIDKAVNAGRSFHVLLPITHELRKLSGHLRKAELQLLHKAYPDKILTNEQETELVELFKDWKEDWADEKMNVYND